jgi:hypothetical protein
VDKHESSLELFKNLLQQNTSKMVEELRIITDFKHHPETELLEFEIHDTFSFVLYPMTKNADQVGGGHPNQNYFIDCYKIPLDLYIQIKRSDIHLDDLNKNYNTLLRVLIEWFSDCWDKVKSDNLLPTYILPHDSNILFDLSNKRWAKMGEQYN